MKRVLKQVIAVGAIALACLQGASCVPEDKSTFLNNLYIYWYNRIVFIENQIQICNFFLSKAELKPKDTLFNTGNSLKLGSDLMSEIVDDCLLFNESWKNLKNLVKLANKINNYIRKKKFTAYDVVDRDFNEIMGLLSSETIAAISSAQTENNLHGRIKAVSQLEKMTNAVLEKLLSKMLSDSTMIIEKIYKFNSHMLTFIEKYSVKKDSASKIHDLVLFKLAKRNKMFAANIIFTFFEIDPLFFFCDGEINRQQLEDMIGSLSNSISRNDNILFFYIRAVMYDIQENKVNALVCADMHFRHTFRGYGVNPSIDKDIIDIYFSLSKCVLSSEETSRYNHIAAEQIIRLIMIEYLMEGYMLNYRKNCLFSNLEKIIVSADFRKQDRIIDALRLLWNDWYCDLRKDNRSLEDFCRRNGINIDFFERLQSNITYSKWVYGIDKASLDLPSSFSRDQLAREMHFDMSYLHPIWYICKRYERISPLSEPDLEFIDKPFMSQVANLVRIRLHKISKQNDSLTREENIRDFMNTCFSLASAEIEILCRPSEYQDSNFTADEFIGFFELGSLEPNGAYPRISREDAV
ncbi:hypothetical protein NEMIN01_0495 [Nematocida minor]|uniref:uncharacterized protein n=1 Tax=Nematocida minor TaxID=1912983 RepID=UPI00222066F0|nr:uncharacterized protein NEMIN01_0495 [Nematocida minor]KAI5189432.1 hypothetical protein NEMIN01_0495 [Nematocida minor]